MSGVYMCHNAAKDEIGTCRMQASGQRPQLVLRRAFVWLAECLSLRRSFARF